MRLLALLGLISISVIVSLVRPFYGLLVFSWLAYMRPQNLAWAGDAYRFSYYISIALLIGCFLNARREKIFTAARENYLMLALLAMLGFSTFFSLIPSNSSPKLMEMAKIILIAILTGSLVNSKQRFKYLSWVIALSIGFLAVKGALRGVFLGWRLRGPSGSMIGDNNDFALALNMCLPLFLYLGMNELKKWRKWLFYLQFPLVITAIIYTYSRGGFVGLLVVIFFIILRSKRKAAGFIILILGLFLFLAFAPRGYKERMETIKTYEKDASAMSRIYAWKVAWRLAGEHPIAGVGLRNMVVVYPKYHWSVPHVAHNSYLQLLAECGFISLGIFLLLLFSSIKKLRALRKQITLTKKTAWIHNYSHMLEIGLIGYMVSGFFLSRADFDLLYQYFGMTVALVHIAKPESFSKKILTKKKEK